MGTDASRTRLPTVAARRRCLALPRASHTALLPRANAIPRTPRFFFLAARPTHPRAPQCFHDSSLLPALRRRSLPRVQATEPFEGPGSPRCEPGSSSTNPFPGLAARPTLLLAGRARPRARLRPATFCALALCARLSDAVTNLDVPSPRGALDCVPAAPSSAEPLPGHTKTADRHVPRFAHRRAGRVRRATRRGRCLRRSARPRPRIAGPIDWPRGTAAEFRTACPVRLAPRRGLRPGPSRARESKRRPTRAHAVGRKSSPRTQRGDRPSDEQGADGQRV